MFRVTGYSGVHIEIAGHTVSAQWGRGNYTSREDARSLGLDTEPAEAPDAELGVWDDSKPRGEGRWIALEEYDDVVGWVKPEEYAWLLIAVLLWFGGGFRKADINRLERLDPQGIGRAVADGLGRWFNAFGVVRCISPMCRGMVDREGDVCEECTTNAEEYWAEIPEAERDAFETCPGCTAPYKPTDVECICGRRN